MAATIDFVLSKRRFNVVEQTIFRLVLEGVYDVEEQKQLLCIYSDEVIANAIKKLVNFQILNANIEMRLLNVSEPLLALMESCAAQSQDLQLPAGVSFQTGDAIHISDEATKRQMLTFLLPAVDIGFLAKSIDFIVFERGSEDEE